MISNMPADVDQIFIDDEMEIVQLCVNVVKFVLLLL